MVVASIAVAARPAIAEQVNMVNALESLQAARASLILASPNKGGHRDRAIQLVDQAIAETRAGIQYYQLNR